MVDMRSVRAISLLQAVVGLATLLCVLVGVFVVGAASARADLFSWSSPIALGITGSSARVVCPSAMQCTAVDSAGKEVTFNPSAPASAAPTTVDGSPGLVASDCPIQTFPQCSQPFEFVGPVPLACPSTSQCTVVDGKGREVTFNPTAPGNPVPIKLDIYSLLGVACASVSQCTAVDAGDQVTFNPAAPGNPIAIGVLAGGLGAVACPAASQCTALDTGDREVTFNPVAPGAATLATVAGAQWLTSVACPSVSQCTAVGSSYVVTFNPAAPGVSTAVTINGGGDLQEVACPSVLQCAVIDRNGRVVTFDPAAHTDSGATAIAGAGLLESIACASVAECVVVDSAGEAFVGVTRPPSITAVHQSHFIWREGRMLAQISSQARRSKHKPPRGTTFSFDLNQPAAITFRFTQRARGRKVKNRCVAPGRKNWDNRVCERTVSVGTLSFAGHDGANYVVFQGLISPSKKLKPGRCTVIITARNVADQTSAPRTLSFSIVK